MNRLNHKHIHTFSVKHNEKPKFDWTRWTNMDGCIHVFEKCPYRIPLKQKCRSTYTLAPAYCGGDQGGGCNLLLSLAEKSVSKVSSSPIDLSITVTDIFSAKHAVQNGWLVWCIPTRERHCQQKCSFIRKCFEMTTRYVHVCAARGGTRVRSVELSKLINFNDLLSLRLPY